MTSPQRVPVCNILHCFFQSNAFVKLILIHNLLEDTVDYSSVHFFAQKSGVAFLKKDKEIVVLFLPTELMSSTSSHPPEIKVIF